MRQSANPVVKALLIAVAVCTSGHARADNIGWTNWTSGTAGSPGSATGSIGNLTVTYSGQTSGLLVNYPSWTPVSTFTGGVVGNAPPQANGSVQIEGGTAVTEAVTFSSAVADPIFAIESLGAGNDQASFNFTSQEPFNILGGGPSSEYGGTGLTKSGNEVLGVEGSGLVQFDGVFSSITFTTPVYENFYMLTVGEDQTLTSGMSGVTPEPSSLGLFGTGLTTMVCLLRRRRVAHSSPRS